MSEIVIYEIPGSPFGRSIEIALEEKGQKYHIHALSAPEIKAE